MMLKENKAHQIFWKTNISYPPDTLIRTRACAYQGVRNDLFSENLACFGFMKTVLRFVLLPHCRRIGLEKGNLKYSSTSGLS